MINIRNSLDAEKAEKLIKIYQFYKAEEDNQKNLLKLFELFSFFKLFQFRCFSFCFIKKKLTVNCIGVLLILLSKSWYIFQRKRKEWDFWWVLLFS